MGAMGAITEVWAADPSGRVGTQLSTPVPSACHSYLMQPAPPELLEPTSCGVALIPRVKLRYAFGAVVPHLLSI